MKHLLLAVALSLAACGGGGSGVSAELNTAATCTGQRLGNLNSVFGEVMAFLGSIGGILPPGVTYTPPDYAITASFGNIAGSVTSPDTISDGIDAGESASASWNLTPTGSATVAGNGTFTVDRISEFVLVIGGNGSVLDGACILNVTNVDLDLDLDSSLGPVGTLDFDAVTPSGPISGTMTFDGSNIAVVEATYLLVQVTFRIDLDTYTVIF